MPIEPRYLRQLGTGRVYVYTGELAKRADMVLHTAQPSVGAEEPSEAHASADEPQLDVEAVQESKHPSHMNKDELGAYAMFNFGIAIDKTQRLSDLRAQVQAMAREGA